jgi:hypothetical protein
MEALIHMKILWYACAEGILFGVYVAGLELIIRGWQLMMATSVASADIGIRDGVIVQLAGILVGRQEPRQTFRLSHK